MNPSELSLLRRRSSVAVRLEAQGECRRMDDELSALVRSVDKLEMQTRLVMKVAGVRPPVEERENDIIAFTATMSTHTFAKANDRLEFDDVIENAGDYYDKDASEFDAPYTGLYMFSLTVRAQFHRKVSAELVRGKSGEDVVLARASSGYGGIERATGSVTVVVELDSGDRVFARQMSDDKEGEYHGQGYTVLAGVMIVQLE